MTGKLEIDIAPDGGWWENPGLTDHVLHLHCSGMLVIMVIMVICHIGLGIAGNQSCAVTRQVCLSEASSILTFLPTSTPLTETHLRVDDVLGLYVVSHLSLVWHWNDGLPAQSLVRTVELETKAEVGIGTVVAPVTTRLFVHLA